MEKEKLNPTRSILTTVVVVLVVLGIGLLIRTVSTDTKDVNEGASLVDSLNGGNETESNEPTQTSTSPVASNGSGSGSAVTATTQSEIVITSPTGGAAWTAGSVYQVSWNGGSGETFVTLVPELPETFTAASAKNAVGVASWNVAAGVRSLLAAVPDVGAGNYQIIVYNEFDAAVSAPFTIVK